jgi:hypothetical protein
MLVRCYELLKFQKIQMFDFVVSCYRPYEHLYASFECQVCPSRLLHAASVPFFLLGRHYHEYLMMVFLLSLQTSPAAMLIVLLHLEIGCLGRVAQ